MTAPRRGDAGAVAASVVDPELPMLTLADLGVLRSVTVVHDEEDDEGDEGAVVVEITPTYTGCPAIEMMRADLVQALHRAGFARVDVRTVLSPPWSTDRITERGRRRLAEAGIAPPGPAPSPSPGPVPLQLTATRRGVVCPQCGSADTEELSRFGPTACTALHRCRRCAEPFEHVKEI